tara:strand:- start:252 stop:869 length:618 start_codon:yes stop_codon:yes gene_type:complete
MKSEIFPVTVFQSKVHGNETLKSVLVPLILDSLDELEIPEDWTTNKVLTSFGQEKDFIENNKQILLNNYHHTTDEFFDKAYGLYFTDFWYNVYQNGEWQEKHDHLGSHVNHTHFSFIHFLSFDKDEHQPPKFTDPLRSIRYLSVEMDSNNCGEAYVPEVEEGDLLMFPSYLQHFVPPGKATDKPRITISFNAIVTQYGDELRVYG